MLGYYLYDDHHLRLRNELPYDACACDSNTFVEVSAREDPVRSLPLAISAIYERHEVNSYMVLRAG